MKEIEDDGNRRKDMLYSWIGRINIVKMTLLPQAIYRFSAAAAKSFQSCPTLCDPIDCSPPGSAVPGILQARTLEWVAISFSNAWKWKVKVKSLSRVQVPATPWTAAYQAPLSVGFSRQEYWSGVSLPSPENLLGLINKFSKFLRYKINIQQLVTFLYTSNSLKIKESNLIYSSIKNKNKFMQAGENCKTLMNRIEK